MSKRNAHVRLLIYLFSAENPIYFGAYKKTQPKTIFNTEPEEGAEQQ